MKYDDTYIVKRILQRCQEVVTEHAYRDEDNDDFLNPQSPYAEIKLLEEKLLKKNSSKIKFISFRFGTISGVSKGINFKEIIILNKKSGKPYIDLIGQTKQILNKKFKGKKSKISLSLSDEKKYAVAFVTISTWIKKK